MMGTFRTQSSLAMFMQKKCLTLCSKYSTVIYVHVYNTYDTVQCTIVHAFWQKTWFTIRLHTVGCNNTILYTDRNNEGNKERKS